MPVASDWLLAREWFPEDAAAKMAPAAESVARFSITVEEPSEARPTPLAASGVEAIAAAPPSAVGQADTDGGEQQQQQQQQRMAALEEEVAQTKLRALKKLRAQEESIDQLHQQVTALQA